MSDTLMDKVWEAYWKPEPHGTQAALERVVALVKEEATKDLLEENQKLRRALECAKPYVDKSVEAASQRGAVTMADVLVPEIIRSVLCPDRDRYDFRGETPVFEPEVLGARI